MRSRVSIDEKPKTNLDRYIDDNRCILDATNRLMKNESRIRQIDRSIRDVNKYIVRCAHRRQCAAIGTSLYQEKRRYEAPPGVDREMWKRFQQFEEYEHQRKLNKALNRNKKF